MNIGKGRDRQDTIGNNGDKVTFLDNYDNLDAYVVNSTQTPPCTVDILIPPMRPFRVPTSSEYGGKVSFQGVECDQWTYTYTERDWVTTYYVAFNATGGYYYPMRIAYSGNQPRVTVTTTSFVVGPTNPSVYQPNPAWDCQSSGDVAGDYDKAHMLLLERAQPARRVLWNQGNDLW